MDPAASSTVKPEQNQAASVAKEVFLRVSMTRFILIMALVFLIITLFEIRVEYKVDYGLERVARIYQGNHLLLNPQEPPLPELELDELERAPRERNVDFVRRLLESRSSELREMAEETDIPSPQLNQLLESLIHRLQMESVAAGVREIDYLRAEYLVDQRLDQLEQSASHRWSRLIQWHSGDVIYYVGPRFFFNLAVAMVFAGFYYYRRKSELALELIDYQAQRFNRVNHQLESKMNESTRIIEKFNQLQDKLLEAEKLASIGQLSATLAHEIRNPLSIIKSSTEIIEEDLNGAEGGTIALNLVRDEINRLDRIISDLLNFARPKEPNLERVWIKETVRHWLPPVVEELEKENIQLVPQLEVDGEVYTDREHLYQIFLNTVWNARDALRGQKNAHLFVRLEDGGDDYMKLVVQDTGMGMLPEVLRQIKEPFFTTKSKGTGLGIPVSIQLMEKMRGKFEVESVVGEGTEVSLWMPRPGFRPESVSSDSGVRNARREHAEKQEATEAKA